MRNDLRRHLIVDLFDGAEEGTVTMSIGDLLDKISDSVVSFFEEKANERRREVQQVANDTGMRRNVFEKNSGGEI